MPSYFTYQLSCILTIKLLNLTPTSLQTTTESKEALLDDYFSTFKVATYATKKEEEVKEEEKEEEPAPADREILQDDFKLEDPQYWEKLLRHHYEQHQEGEYAKMGKGKRIRKAVNYYTEGLESLSTKKEEDEFDDHDDDDFDDDDGGPRKKMRRAAGNFPNKPHEAALPPLLARVSGQLEVLGFNSRQRRSFLNAVMRYGMPLSDAYHSNWRPRDLKNKTEKEFNAYVSLFMRHLCEPDNGNSHYFADGVPKEGLPRQQVLARIGVMGLIRRKVHEYAHINGDLPSRPGSPDGLTSSHAQAAAAAVASLAPQPATSQATSSPGTPQLDRSNPSTPQPAGTSDTSRSTPQLETSSPSTPATSERAASEPPLPPVDEEEKKETADEVEKKKEEVEEKKEEAESTEDKPTDEVTDEPVVAPVVEEASKPEESMDTEEKEEKSAEGAVVEETEEKEKAVSETEEANKEEEAAAASAETKDTVETEQVTCGSFWIISSISRSKISPQTDLLYIFIE